MKRCKMCGSAMNVAAELTEGGRHYTWYKCLNINCGSVFLVQKPISNASLKVDTKAQANAVAG